MHPVEVRTIAKVARLLVPFLIVCYFIAYLDRVNVGFAALTMNQDLGLSQTTFGILVGRGGQLRHARARSELDIPLPFDSATADALERGSRQAELIEAGRVARKDRS